MKDFLISVGIIIFLIIVNVLIHKIFCSEGGLHNWNGCTCTKCKKNRKKKHKWDRCKCTVCNERRNLHEWDGCICKICGMGRKSWDNNYVLQLNDHKINDKCVCEKCKKHFHEWDGCVCSKCGCSNYLYYDRYNDNAQHVYEEGSCTCKKCGKKHKLSGCKCTICGEIVHIWSSGVTNWHYTCSRCGATKHVHSGNVNSPYREDE